MSQLPALLRTDLSQMAERVRRAGRGRDTMLAHITPQEAELLRARGGSGTINPATGLPEFLDYPYPPESYDYAYYVPEATEIVELPQKPPIVPLSVGDLGEGAFQYPAPPTADGDTGPSSRGAVPSAAPQEIPSSPAARPALPSIERSVFESFNLPDTGDPFFADGRAFQYPVPVVNLDRTAAGGLDQEREQAIRSAIETVPMQARGGIEDALRGAARQAGEFVKTPLGYGAIGGIPALLQARRASQQARGMREELGRLGQEARTQGQQLVAQARGGQVTAAQQQALNAQRAAAMQNLSRRGITGGTAAQQVERSLQEQKGRFLEDTLNQGMRLLQVADQYTERAIRAQYAADAQAQQLLGNFFQNYMRVLAGQPGTTTTTPTSTPLTTSGR